MSLSLLLLRIIVAYRIYGLENTGSGYLWMLKQVQHDKHGNVIAYSIRNLGNFLYSRPKTVELNTSVISIMAFNGCNQ